MNEGRYTSTNFLLLERLRTRPGDEAAWDELVRGYEPAIRRWCRAWGLQPADADDIAQTVLCKLARKMATFRYDRSRSFRGYLKTLTRHAVCDALESFRKEKAESSAALDELAISDTRDELARCLERELRRDLFREASARVALRTESKTWEAFWLLSWEARPGQEVADRLGMTLAAVYMAKSRVIKMMRDEIRALSRLMSDDNTIEPA